MHAGGLAKVVAVDELREAPCKASVLFPRSGGNIHTLTAVTPCALLDVLAPPYAEDLGRPSTYISDTPIPSLPGMHLYMCIYAVCMPDFLFLQSRYSNDDDTFCILQVLQYWKRHACQRIFVL